MMLSIFFPVALMLIIFLGGELFTGNVMYMIFGILSRNSSFSDMAKLWSISYFGNFAGKFTIN